MDTTNRYFLHLLSCFVNKSPPHLPYDNINWSLLFKLSKINSVTGIIGYMIDKLPGGYHPPSEIESKFYSSILYYHEISTRRMSAYNSLCKHFIESGIDFAAFKGACVRDLYPVAHLRSFGDIDILIRPVDRDHCHQLMESLGFKSSSNRGIVCTYRRDIEHYEIHTNIMPVNISKNIDMVGFFKDTFSRCSKISPHVFKLDKEYHLIYLLVHIAKHIHSDGAGIRMYMDIAVYITNCNDTLDWNMFIKQMQEIDLYEFSKTVFYAVSKWFGCPLPFDINPLSPDVFESFENYTIFGGTFGFNRNISTSRIRISMEQGKKSPRLASYASIFFPSYKNMREQYPFLNGRPILLPLVWIMRYFKGIFKKRKKSVNLLTGILSKEDEALKHVELFESIGLNFKEE